MGAVSFFLEGGALDVGRGIEGVGVSCSRLRLSRLA